MNHRSVFAWIVTLGFVTPALSAAAPLVAQMGVCWPAPEGDLVTGFGNTAAQRRLAVRFSLAAPVDDPPADAFAVQQAIDDTLSVTFCHARVAAAGEVDSLTCPSTTDWTFYFRGPPTRGAIEADKVRPSTAGVDSPPWLEFTLPIDYADAATWSNAVIVPVVNAESVPGNLNALATKNGFCAVPQLLSSGPAQIFGVPEAVSLPNAAFPSPCQGASLGAIDLDITLPNPGNVAKRGAGFACGYATNPNSIGGADYTNAILEGLTAYFAQFWPGGVTPGFLDNGTGPAGATITCAPGAACPQQIFIAPPDGQSVSGLAFEGRVTPDVGLVYINSESRFDRIPSVLDLSVGEWEVAQWREIVTHEEFHHVQNKSQADFGGSGDAYWVEPSAQVIGAHACLEAALPAELLSEIPCASAEAMYYGRLVAPAAVTDAFELPELGTFSRDGAPNGPRRAAYFLRYVAEQYAYPVHAASPSHPRGTQSQWAVPVADPADPLLTADLLDRQSNEGLDLIGHIMTALETTGDRGPSPDTHPACAVGSPAFDQAYCDQITSLCANPAAEFFERVDCALLAHVGRRWRDLLVDYHTALVLKDYAEIDPRWRFEWVDDFFANTPATDVLGYTGRHPLRQRKPFVDQATGEGFLPGDDPAFAPTDRPNSSSDRYPDRLPRARRVQDSWVRSGVTGVASAPFTSFLTTGRDVALRPYGSAVASIRPTEDPTDPANQNGLDQTITLFIDVEQGEAPLFRVFLVDLTTDPKGVVRPLEACATQPGEVCTVGLDRKLGLPIVLTPGVREVILIASGGATDTLFSYRFASGDGPQIEIVAPTRSQRATVGVANPALLVSKIPFLMDLSVRDRDNPVLGLDPTRLQITINGLLCDDCVATPLTQSLTGQYSFLVTLADEVYLEPGLDDAVFPVESGTLLDLGVEWEELSAANVDALAIGSNVGSATELVLDFSDSMRLDGKIETLREVASFLLEQLAFAEDELGVVGFRHDSWVIDPMSPLTFARFMDLDDAIRAIPAGSGTSIGDALFRAQDELTLRFLDLGAQDAVPSGIAAPPNVLLVSDGMSTCNAGVSTYLGTTQTDDAPGEIVVGGTCDNSEVSPPFVVPDAPPYVAEEVGFLRRLDNEGGALFTPRISALAVGPTVDLASLGTLTALSGGSLIEVQFDDSLPDAPDPTALPLQFGPMIGGAVGLINASRGMTRLRADFSRSDFEVEPGTTALSVSVASMGAAPTRRLRHVSSGTLVDPSSSGPASAIFDITSPAPGTWSWESIAEPGDVFVDVSVDHPVQLVALVGINGGGTLPAGLRTNPDTQGVQGRRIELAAVVHENGVPITNAIVEAEVTLPGHATSVVRLEDDGRGRDSVAADGSFGGAFIGTALAGVYEVRVVASGVSPSSGASFRREQTKGVAIDFAFDTVPNGIPDWWEDRYQTNGADEDEDADGLNNAQEFARGTLPLESDTDGSGEADGSEVLAGRSPLLPDDDAIGMPLPAIVAGNGKVVLSAGVRSRPALLVEARRVEQPLGPPALLTAVTADDVYELEAENGVEACFRIRLVQGSVFSGWSAPRCATPAADPVPPELQLDVARCHFGDTLPVGLRVTDGAVWDDMPFPVDLGIESGGIVEYRVQLGLSSDFSPPELSDWLPFEPHLEIPKWLLEAEYVYLQVRDAAGNESNFAQVTLETCECAPRSYEAESIDHSGGAPIPGGWKLSSAGSVSTTHPFLPAPTRITVRAKGQKANFVWPVMKVFVDGTQIGSAVVSSTSWQNYAFDLTPERGVQDVHVVFDNPIHHGTRILFLDKLTIECRPNCVDRILNQDETDVDCGGACGPNCDEGRACDAGDDCRDGICNGGLCQPPTCDDGVENGDEGGVDCGGSCPGACPACDDGLENGDEEGVDCGGSCPSACLACDPSVYQAEAMFHSTGGSTPQGWNLWDNGHLSTQHAFQGVFARIRIRAKGDPALGVWPHMVVSVAGVPIGNVFVASSSWTDYDFYLSAPTGSRELRVAFDNDYYSPPHDRNLYVDQVTVECVEASCDDGLLNGDETDADCGGDECELCPNGADCDIDLDCASDQCVAGVCQPPTGSHTYGFETGVEGWTNMDAPAVATTTATSPVFQGSKSLKISVQSVGAGAPRVWVQPAVSPPPGATVTYRVYFPSGAPIYAVQPYVADGNWAWAESWNPASGSFTGSWRTFSVNVPSGAAIPAREVGIKVYLSGSYTGVFYLDAVSW